MAVNPADLDPDPDPALDPGPGPAPVRASAARPNDGSVRAALTSRAAGWVVATLLAGALTGLAVNVATAPSATVVRQVSIVAPAGLGRTISLSPSASGSGFAGPCQVPASGLRIYLPAKGGSKTITAVPVPAPSAIARSAKVHRVSFTVRPGAPVPPPALQCALGLVAPGAQCNVVGPRSNISIHVVGPAKQVIVRRQFVQVKPGGPTPVQVPAFVAGPGVRFSCSG